MRPWKTTNSPQFVAIGVAAAVFGAGWWLKEPCRAAGWPYDPALMFGQRCYTDLPVLYSGRGLAEGRFPYAGEFEYPVLTGYVADLTARLTGDLMAFVALNAVLLLGCALVTVWAAGRTRYRPLDGLLVAAAPTLALAGLINWDLFAVAATALALLAWARERPILAGALLGLGTAAKLYPALILGPLVVLALRDRDPGRALRAVGGAAVAWGLVNLPVALAHPEGWTYFWRFNADRGAEFGSIWYALHLLDHPVEPLNPVAIGLFAAACLGIAVLAVRAPVPPTLPALAFLTVGAFVVTNKVYSPQYVLWLVPLAVLAGVSMVEFWAWQATEVLYWLAVWHYLAVGETWHYPAATVLRTAATVWLLAAVAWRSPGRSGRQLAQRMCSLRQVEPSAEYAVKPGPTMS